MPKDALLDLSLLQDYKDNLGIELLKEMLALYEEKVIIYLDEIKEAISRKDDQKWYDKCHKMKGAASSMGFLCLTKHLKEIEHAISDSETRTEYYQTIILLNENVIIAFKCWLINN